MLSVKQRGRIKGVTNRILILVDAEPGEQGYPASFSLPEEPPGLVREFEDADFRRVLRRLREDEKAHFFSLVELITALQSNDALALTHARERLEKSLELRRKPPESKMNGLFESDDSTIVLTSIFGLQPGQEVEASKLWYGLALSAREKQDARWLLSRQLSARLHHVELVLWWTGKYFAPALYCGHEPSALYVRALLGLAGTTKTLMVCPHCGTPFIQERTDQQYCSVAHREAHRVARWRARKKGGKKNPQKVSERRR